MDDLIDTKGIFPDFNTVDRCAIGINWGGLGDCIARAPAVKTMLESYPNVKFRFYVQGIGLDLYVYWFSNYANVEFIKNLNDVSGEEGPGHVKSFNGTKHHGLGMHLVDHGYLSLLERMPLPTDNKNYLSLNKFPLYPNPKFVALTPNYTAGNRTLADDQWEPLIDGILSRGLEVHLCGSIAGLDPLKNRQDLLDKVKDMWNKHPSTLDCAEYLANAQAVIGVDNGLIHLAACTEVPIVVAYTSQLAAYRIPIREKGKIEVVSATSPCNGCEVKLRFVENFNFKYCYTKTLECVKTITASRLLTALDKVL